MYVDHVTIHVPPGFLYGGSGVSTFFDILGFKEMEPEEAPEGLQVRWWRPGDVPTMPLIHLVEGPSPKEFHPFGMWDQPVLGHFAIATSSEHMVNIKQQAQMHGWLERDSGSSRFWLRCGNIRVEVRPL
jgi:hypothetical protein